MDEGSGNGRGGCQRDAHGHRRMLVKGLHFGQRPAPGGEGGGSGGRGGGGSLHRVLMNGRECGYTGLWHVEDAVPPIVHTPPGDGAGGAGGAGGVPGLPTATPSYIDTFACAGVLPQPGGNFTVEVAGQSNTLSSPTLVGYTVTAPSPTAQVGTMVVAAVCVKGMG